jgi:hypothetical protein
MQDQHTPGHDIIDLRDVLGKYTEILCRAEVDKEEWEFDYLAEVDNLKRQLFCELDRYAENEPILILDIYFEQYAQEMAEDIGAIDKAAEWPCTCIDWTEAAEQLKQDFVEFDFGGHTYFGRVW